MNIKAIVHEAEEGGFWAEVPAIPGCATRGKTFARVLSGRAGSFCVLLAATTFMARTAA
jgi:hypothetical protein